MGTDYNRIRAHYAGGDEAPAQDPHIVLGVEPGVSLDALRIAYHRLPRESHPDLVIAQGLPPECIALATARAARIDAAYDQLARGHAGLPVPG
jgi:DnaJ like chaperone protein